MAGANVARSEVDRSGVWHVSANEMLDIFRASLIDLIPTFERARINWRHSTYDDFDRIAEALFDSIVRDSIVNSRGHENAVELAPYGGVSPGREYSRILVDDVSRRLAFLELITVERPFDTIRTIQVGTDGIEQDQTATFPYGSVPFACELRLRVNGAPMIVSEFDVLL